MMNLLRDKSPNIQFEAFHVFKVKCRRNNQGICFFRFPVANSLLFTPLYLRENEIGSLSILHDLDEILELF